MLKNHDTHDFPIGSVNMPINCCRLDIFANYISLANKKGNSIQPYVFLFTNCLCRITNYIVVFKMAVKLYVVMYKILNENKKIMNN